MPRMSHHNSLVDYILSDGDVTYTKNCVLLSPLPFMGVFLSLVGEGTSSSDCLGLVSLIIGILLG